jgi:hypothetical protein
MSSAVVELIEDRRTVRYGDGNTLIIATFDSAKNWPENNCGPFLIIALGCDKVP